MKKLNILFDAYVLAECDNTGASRSGIFFTALNILKEFSKNENINISIYCSNKKFSTKLEKATLSEELQRDLSEKGVAIVPLPEELINRSKLEAKVCRQYALPQFAENIVLIDTGYAKMMTPFFPLEQLRRVKGFENVRFADPYAGGKGNSIRYMAITERDEYMKVRGVHNLFCGGEKAGPFIGHTEAISTGALAGHNAGNLAAERRLLSLPDTTAVGALLRFEKSDGGMFTFAGDEFFAYLQEQGLYNTDREAIAARIEAAGLTGVYDC